MKKYIVGIALLFLCNVHAMYRPINIGGIWKEPIDMLDRSPGYDEFLERSKGDSSLISIYNASNSDIDFIAWGNPSAKKKVTKDGLYYDVITINPGKTFYYYKSCNETSSNWISFLHPTIDWYVIYYVPHYSEFLEELVLGTFDHATRKIVIKTPLEKIFSWKGGNTIHDRRYLRTIHDQSPMDFFLCGTNINYVIDVDYNVARVENDVTMSLPTNKYVRLR